MERIVYGDADTYGNGVQELPADLIIVPNENILRALKLSYIKLTNVGAFRADPKAEQQILAAIRTLEPDFVYDPNANVECHGCRKVKAEHYQLGGGGGGLYCRPNLHSPRYTPTRSHLNPPDLEFAANLVRQWSVSKPTDTTADRDSDLRQAVSIIDRARAV